LCCSRSVPGRRVQAHISHRCPSADFISSPQWVNADDSWQTCDAATEGKATDEDELQRRTPVLRSRQILCRKRGFRQETLFRKADERYGRRGDATPFVIRRCIRQGDIGPREERKPKLLASGSKGTSPCTKHRFLQKGSIIKARHLLWAAKNERSRLHDIFLRKSKVDTSWMPISSYRPPLRTSKKKSVMLYSSSGGVHRQQIKNIHSSVQEENHLGTKAFVWITTWVVNRGKFSNLG
jgi:hypothetical protein